jgi:hypothetical protein
MSRRPAKYPRNDVVPYEHRGHIIQELANQQPPSISELANALSIERDPALRKLIVLALLRTTNSADIPSLLSNVGTLSSKLPSESTLDETIQWRLPY